MADKAFGILYIDAKKLYLYTSTNNSVLQVDIPADVMSYFDIINKEKFYQILQSMLTTNKIPPVPVLVLVAPAASYERDITGKTPDEIATQSQQFLDVIPFEKVLSKTYKMQAVSKVVATNRDLYEATRFILEKLHFSSLGIVSLAVVQKMMPEVGTSVNLEMLASKIDTLKQYGFTLKEEIYKSAETTTTNEVDSNKPNPMRLYAMIGVFVVLLVVLGITIYFAMQPAPTVKVIKPPRRTAPIATSTPMPIINPSTGTPSAKVTSSPTK